MIRRLLAIEFKKLWASRYFRVLGILWLIAFVGIPVGAASILYSVDVGNISDLIPLAPRDFPIFDFQDVWQNLAFVYKFQTILLSFMVIISVCNEFDYKTVRQNIIDGFSRTQFWWSKVMLVIILSTLATILLTVEGFVAGFIASPVTSAEFVFMNIEFMGAYWLNVTLFLMFCLVMSLWIRRAGFTIFFVLIWAYVLEMIAYWVNLAYYYEGEVSTMLYSAVLPLESASNLIRNPLSKYVLQETQDYVGTQDLGIALAWLGIFLFLSHRFIQRRDL